MDFRWKNFGTPAGIEAANKMQGYVPGYVGREPRAVPEESVISPSGTFGGGNRGPGQEAMQQFQPGYFENAERVQLQARYQQLQNELTQVDAKIAEVKKKYPGITNEREWRIAAKRAEIGDMSAYDNMMARGRDASQGVSGVENSLYNVLKLGWGLKTNRDEDAQITLANMNTELQKAEEWSQKTGQPLPRVYYEVKKAVDEYNAKNTKGGTGAELVRNAEEAINKLNHMVAEGNFPKAEYDKYDNWVKQNPNSEFAKPIADWLAANKGKTKEARAAAAGLAKQVKALYDRIHGMAVDKQTEEVSKAPLNVQKAFKAKYKYDEKKGYK